MRTIDGDELLLRFIPRGGDNPFTRFVRETVRLRVAEMPTIEVEPLTDKEQRIFLAAMAREEKVCKEVDEECRDCQEPYEDSLVKICHEITRKVKSVLWT